MMASTNFLVIAGPIGLSDQNCLPVGLCRELRRANVGHPDLHRTIATLPHPAPVLAHPLPDSHGDHVTCNAERGQSLEVHE